MLGPLDIAFEVTAVLDDLSIDYALGGSLASSTFGEPRATNDIDLAVVIDTHDLPGLANELRRRDYYWPEQSAARAVATESSFNVIHPTGFKVDLFVLGDRVLDRHQLQRRVAVELSTDPPRTLWVTSPADQVLRKLDWYRLGQEGSDRQWRDIIGLLQAQGNHLDLTDLRDVANQIGLAELLERALLTSGLADQ